MTTQSTTPFYVLASRVFWMMLGPLLLTIPLLHIVTGGNGWLTAADFIFVVLLGGIVLARWLEFRSGNAQTATGEPATQEQLHRYALIATIVGLSVWVVANLLGNHWLGN